MGPQEHIEKELLGSMVENTPEEHAFGYFFPFKYLERLTGYDREIVRGFMRSMRGRGLVQYGVGFDDDGIPAGGGYTIVPAGAEHLRNLKQKLCAEREMERRATRQSDWGGVDYA